MQYRVIAKKRSGFDGFRRSGKFFSSEHETLLEEEEMTEGIRNEPLLHVIPVSEDESDNIDAQARIKELSDELDRNKADAETASALIEAVKAEKIKFEGEAEALKVQLTEALKRIEELESQLEPAPGENDLPELLQAKLDAAGYNTKQKLSEATDEELLAVHGVGKESLKQIRDSLSIQPETPSGDQLP